LKNKILIINMCIILTTLDFYYNLAIIIKIYISNLYNKKTNCKIVCKFYQYIEKIQKIIIVDKEFKEEIEK